MRSKELDGQMTLFGGEPYQPKKAGAGADHPVELDTEAEEFLSVGRRRKKAQEKAEEPEQAKEVKPEKEENASEEEKPVMEAEKQKSAEKPGKRTSSGYHIVMQRSFVGADGSLATTAYLDYNLVYVDDPEGKASLTHFQDSKKAVDRYLSEIERFEKTLKRKRSEKHPALKNVTVQEDKEL